jgi:hypothetical protein
LDDEMQCAIDAINDRIDDLKEHLRELRAADQEAIKVALVPVTEKMQGFPEEYATKPDMDAVKEALQKLERDAISREIYEEQSKNLSDLVNRLDRDKMNEKDFQAFVAQYRDHAEAAAIERRAVAAGLAESTSVVAQTLANRDTAEQATAGTYKRLAAMIGFATGLATLIISIVVLFANNAL